MRHLSPSARGNNFNFFVDGASIPEEAEYRANRKQKYLSPEEKRQMKEFYKELDLTMNNKTE